jgi:hypothetical protein
MANTDPPNESNPSQQWHYRGLKPGLPNYQNNKLIPIIEHVLPNGTEAWCLVAIAYKEELVKKLFRQRRI